MLNILYGLSHHVCHELHRDKRKFNINEIGTVT